MSSRHETITYTLTHSLREDMAATQTIGPALANVERRQDPRWMMLQSVAACYSHFGNRDIRYYQPLTVTEGDCG